MNFKRRPLRPPDIHYFDGGVMSTWARLSELSVDYSGEFVWGISDDNVIMLKIGRFLGDESEYRMVFALSVLRGCVGLLDI